MDSKFRVIVHRGSKEIGGSCIEVATDRHRVLLDAGAPLDASAPAVLPPIPGVTAPGDAPEAVLLSHAHQDHSGLLHHVPGKVPVYLSRGTSKMLLAGEVFCRHAPVPRGRQRILPPSMPVRIGDMTVTALPVDHSVYGAVAFLIEAHGRRVLYSGDLRFHGRHSQRTETLVEAVADRPLDLLLIDGTHLSRRAEAVPTREWQLEKEIFNSLSGAPSLALAFLSPMNVDRLRTFYAATRLSGRTLVVDLYGAFILHMLRSEAAALDPARALSLRVYLPQRRPAMSRFEGRLAGRTITLEEVLAAPSRYVMLCRPSMLERDFGGTVPTGTTGFYSMWRGYLEREEWKATQRIISEANGEFHECHTSGHAAVGDLIKLIGQLNPRRVVPIHTDRPELMRNLVPNVELSRDGEAILVPIMSEDERKPAAPKVSKNIIDATDPIITEALNAVGHGRKGFHTKTTALELSKIEPKDASLGELVKELWKQIVVNWVEHGCRPGGNENWRWRRVDEMDEDNPSKETRLEKELAKVLSDSWANQVPTSSGLLTSSSDRKRNIDLAYWQPAEQSVTAIELKIESDTPVYAAFQIVRNALLLCLARTVPDKIAIVSPDVWQKTRLVHLRVLAPKSFFTGYQLGWLERQLDHAVGEFGRAHGMPMTFAYRYFAKTPESEVQLEGCLEGPSPYAEALEY